MLVGGRAAVTVKRAYFNLANKFEWDLYDQRTLPVDNTGAPGMAHFYTVREVLAFSPAIRDWQGPAIWRAEFMCAISVYYGQNVIARA